MPLSTIIPAGISLSVLALILVAWIASNELPEKAPKLSVKLKKMRKPVNSLKAAESIVLPLPPVAPQPTVAVVRKKNLVSLNSNNLDILPASSTKPEVKITAPRPKKFLQPKPHRRKTEQLSTYRMKSDPKPFPSTAGRTKTPSRKIIKKGRILLRHLEHGTGPSIEIAWPESASQRRRLYKRFKGCYGVRLAVMSGTGKLFQANGNSGEVWAINLDRYSGFIRQISGLSTRAEQEITNNIRQFHGLKGTANSVRVFPRTVDAIILGGLGQIIGSDYQNLKSIKARYVISGIGVQVADILADGRERSGSIVLPSSKRECARG